MSIDFRENIDPVFAKIFAKIESKIFAKIVRKSRNFFRNERKFSRNFRENRVSRFSLETLVTAPFYTFLIKIFNCVLLGGTQGGIPQGKEGFSVIFYDLLVIFF